MAAPDDTNLEKTSLPGMKCLQLHTTESILWHSNVRWREALWHSPVELRFQKKEKKKVHLCCPGLKRKSFLLHSHLQLL